MAKLTIKKMKRELAQNGYFFNRELTNEEVRAEYEQMLDDMSIDMDAINPLSIKPATAEQNDVAVESSVETINQPESKEDVTMNNQIETVNEIITETRQSLMSVEEAAGMNTTELMMLLINEGHIFSDAFHRAVVAEYECHVTGVAHAAAINAGLDEALELAATGTVSTTDIVADETINQPSKEDETMINNNQSVTSNGLTKLGMMKFTLINIKDYTKTSDDLYVTNDKIRDVIEEVGGNRPGKKFKRAELVSVLTDMFNNAMAAETAPKQEEVASTPASVTPAAATKQDFTTGNATHMPTPVNAVKPVPTDAQVSDARRRTEFVLKLVAENAISNKGKGYGTTVSAYMLVAHICHAAFGMKKLKGNESKVTAEQKQKVSAVRKWLLDNGYIKPCTYKTTDSRIVYVEDLYDGDNKAKLVPMSKSKGLVAKEVTSYKVCFNR